MYMVNNVVVRVMMMSLIIAAGDQHRVEITGGTHAGMMSLENPVQIVSIAPAEGQKSLFIMSGPNFELICNPDKFCFGEGGFGKGRQRKITYMCRKYSVFQCQITRH